MNLADHVMRLLDTNGPTGMDDMLEWIREDILEMGQSGQIEIEDDGPWKTCPILSLSETGQRYIDAKKDAENDDLA